MEIKLNAEYLDFKSYEDVLNFQNELLSMPINETRKRLMGLVAKQDLWYKLLFRYCEMDYQKALKNGSKSIESDMHFKDYISLSDYRDYIINKVNRAGRSMQLHPLLSVNNPYETKEIKEISIEKIKKITGFDDIEQLFDNYCRLKSIYEPTVDLAHAYESFIGYECDENGERIEIKELSDEVRNEFHIKFEKISEIAEIIDAEEYPEEMVNNLKSAIGEVDEYLKASEQFDIKSEVISRLRKAIGKFDRVKPIDSYTIVRDKQKEEELNNSSIERPNIIRNIFGKISKASSKSKKSSKSPEIKYPKSKLSGIVVPKDQLSPLLPNNEESIPMSDQIKNYEPDDK